VVGAEIVERVRFPYPVSPIVRSHHERWDGSGYPDGLAGEEIPTGARILAAVDCLDALASDRQYRRALPLDEAMRMVASLSGTSYDPRVVAVLQARYRELEQKARSEQTECLRPRERNIERGHAPGAGLERTAASLSSRPEFLMSIAAAREEVQTLYELSQDLGSSLSLHETLSVLDVRLRRMIPYDGIAVWVQRGQVLKPEYVQGENHRLFSSLEIPVGEGLSGWVAENGKPIINGNPSVEPGYLDDPAKFSTLRSALSVRLETASGALGVLTLYHADRDAFTPDHLRVLLAIVSKASLALENALKFRQAEISATTDGLTGLPNARSLFLHLDAELERSRRSGTPVAVLVCDLDGFKQVNDRFGHLEGNEVLKRVAQQMKERCREYDYVARMGGDEFVLVLPGLTRAGVRRKTRVIAQVARNAGLEVCGEPLLSMSVGEAYYPDHGTNAEQLLAEADRQMYHAKKQHKMETELVPAMTTELEMLSMAVQ
jgi:diguanylate cyclase (GGDEF)-like protein